jgi:uncharacterized protein
MSKILFLVGSAVLIYLLLRQQWTRGGRKAQTRQTASAATESMVSCAYCKLHIPLTESLKHGSRHYCSEEHQRLHGGHGGT